MRPSPTAFRAIHWRAVLMGATSGLLVMVVLSYGGFVLINGLGGGGNQILLVVTIANFVAQFLAGLVAGRFAFGAAIFNGSIAGLGFFAVSTALQIIDGARVGAFTLLFFGAVSALLGAAGGALIGRGR